MTLQLHENLQKHNTQTSTITNRGNSSSGTKGEQTFRGQFA
jgi:hypothetical protein